MDEFSCKKIEVGGFGILFMVLQLRNLELEWDFTFFIKKKKKQFYLIKFKIVAEILCA